LFVAAAFGAPMGLCKASARCCGYPLYAGGAHEQFVQHALSFARSLEAYPELVVLDPGCAHTLSVVYPRFGVELPSRIRTVYEVLADNLPHAPNYAPLEEAAGYHDACHLGRGLGQYDEPRALLKRAVRTVGEAPSNREEGGCAGGGGLLPRTMPEISVEVARRQALEVAPAGQTVVTACPTSRRVFERAGKRSEDLVSILRRWLEAANEGKIG
jgi:Fe-S oxidoreductase